MDDSREVSGPSRRFRTLPFAPSSPGAYRHGTTGTSEPAGRHAKTKRGRSANAGSTTSCGTTRGKMLINRVHLEPRIDRLPCGPRATPWPPSPTLRPPNERDGIPDRPRANATTIASFRSGTSPFWSYRTRDPQALTVGAISFPNQKPIGGDRNQIETDLSGSELDRKQGVEGIRRRTNTPQWPGPMGRFRREGTQCSLTR